MLRAWIGHARNPPKVGFLLKKRLHFLHARLLLKRLTKTQRKDSFLLPENLCKRPRCFGAFPAPSSKDYPPKALFGAFSSCNIHSLERGFSALEELLWRNASCSEGFAFHMLFGGNAFSPETRFESEEFFFQRSFLGKDSSMLLSAKELFEKGVGRVLFPKDLFEEGVIHVFFVQKCFSLKQGKNCKGGNVFGECAQWFFDVGEEWKNGVGNVFGAMFLGEGFG